MPTDVPHLSMPLRLDGTSLAVSEQDTLDEVADCVANILRYRRGHRIDLPAFGVDEQALRQGGADEVEITEAIETWEPRARSEIDAGVLDQLLQEVRVDVRGPVA